MNYTKERKRLFQLFQITAVLFFFVINFGHYLTYRPLISRIDTFAEAAYNNKRVELFSYINHNAQLADILAMKLENVAEAIPIITEPENQIDLLKVKILEEYDCYLSKESDSYKFQLKGAKQTYLLVLKNLNKKGWTGGLKYAIGTCIFLLLLGFIVSRKLPNYIVQEYFG